MISIKEIINKIKAYWSVERCYNKMEDKGKAVFGMCDGMCGGDKHTEYLSYSCVDCPHYTPVPRMEKNEFKTNIQKKLNKNSKPLNTIE